MPDPGNIVIRKATDPPGSPQSFPFTASYRAPFNLIDGESNDSGPLTAGTYSAAETALVGWRTFVSAVRTTRGSPGGTVFPVYDPSAIVVADGTTTTITFLGLHADCTEMVVEDANGKEIVVAGGADGNLYLLYDGISDYDGSENGKFFTAEALALKYVGPQRTVIRDLEWYGDQNAEFFIAKELTTEFDSTKMQALGDPEEVQDDENSNHWRAKVAQTMQTIHAYVLLRLQGYEGGTMELNDPPHMPVETYGRVLLVSPSAAGSNPR